MQYPVHPTFSTTLSTGAKGGVGAGAAVAGIAVVALAFLLVRRTLQNRKDRAELDELRRGTAQPTPTSVMQAKPEAEGLPYNEIAPQHQHPQGVSYYPGPPQFGTTSPYSTSAGGMHFGPSQPQQQYVAHELNTQSPPAAYFPQQPYSQVQVSPVYSSPPRSPVSYELGTRAPESSGPLPTYGYGSQQQPYQQFSGARPSEMPAEHQHQQQYQ